jgi:1-acyl-sn-glycerol-3-phosphate acyltransferase
MPPEYPSIPLDLIAQLAGTVLGKGKRSFRRDALHLTRHLPIKILAEDNIPRSGPGVVLVNHYYRPGFFAGWIALAVSAAVPVELTWTMTAAWTAVNTPWMRVKSALSTILFPRLAQVYGFIPMPPMPPRPHETLARAKAVRQILAAAHSQPPRLLALAPEGQDPTGGGLMHPHPGVGRMLARLAGLGCVFHPVGVYENSPELVLDFGPRLLMSLPYGMSPGEIDSLAADAVMRAIAARLPESLRGVYA